jgi:hypothetical protein
MISSASARQQGRIQPWCLRLLLAASVGAAGSALGAAPAPVPCPVASCGALSVNLDAFDGAFSDYSVTVSSLQLLTAGGSAVELLQDATPINLVGLVDLASALSAGQIPAGDYVGAKMIVNYSNAAIDAKNPAGQTVTLKPVNATGAALTGAQTINVQLDGGQHLIVKANDPATFDVDFDLTASNKIDFSNATVQVTPSLSASVVPSQAQRARLTGTLASTDTSESTFVAKLSANQTPGTVTVAITPTTRLSINGTLYTGAAGLEALAVLPDGTPIGAFGFVESGSQVVQARSVVAGK